MIRLTKITYLELIADVKIDLFMWKSGIKAWFGPALATWLLENKYAKFVG